jgi:hypothetical protein
MDYHAHNERIARQLLADIYRAYEALMAAQTEAEIDQQTALLLATIHAAIRITGRDPLAPEPAGVVKPQ